MVRFYSVNHLMYIMIKSSHRGMGKYTYHNYITLLIFYKSRYLRYKLFPFLLPTYKSYLLFYN